MLFHFKKCLIMTNHFIKFLFFSAISISMLTFSACQRDDDDVVDPGNEQEVITTVQITFDATAGATGSETFVFSDPDGPGGQAPLVDNIVLTANATYEVTLDFLDASGPTPVFLTDEVQDEAEEHLICYFVNGALPALTIKDQDVNGEALGLVAELQTGAAGNGILTIVLKHEPMKGNVNACDSGETDVEAAFSVTIN